MHIANSAQAHSNIDLIPNVASPDLHTNSEKNRGIAPQSSHESRTSHPQSFVSSNIQVTSDPVNEPQNEPAITIDSLDNSLIVAGANDYRLVAQGHDAWLGVYVSKNNGTSWTNSLIPGYPGGPTATLSGYTTGSDPSLAFDQSGNLYYAGIVFVRTSSGGGIDGSVFLARSIDNGTTWSETIAALGSSSRHSSVFNDKPYLAVDTITNSTFKGRVYISWTQFVNNGGGTILFSESNNGGSTFSSPVTLSNSPDNQGSVPYVGPNGTLYVAWYDLTNNEIKISGSSDGGASFSAPVVATLVVPLPTTLPTSSFRENSFPTLAVDPVSGTVYIAWSDYRNGNADILFIRSTNKAVSFSVPVRVNDDSGTNDQFFPWMQSVSGKVALVWYDRRLDPANHNMDVYYAESRDQGVSFKQNIRITDVSSNPDCCGFGGQFIGDYIGLSLTPTIARPVWMDTRNGNQDVFSEKYPPSPKVSIASMTLSRNVMYDQVPSNPLNTTVVVLNNSPYNETITVVFSLQNSTTTLLLTNQTTPVPANLNATFAFTTATQFLSSGNFSLVAHVLPVPGQSDLSSTTVSHPFQVRFPGDINGDHSVNILDVILVNRSFGTACGGSNYNAPSDINNDCKINILDVTIVGSNFGRTG